MNRYALLRAMAHAMLREFDDALSLLPDDLGTAPPGMLAETLDVLRDQLRCSRRRIALEITRCEVDEQRELLQQVPELRQ